MAQILGMKSGIVPLGGRRPRAAAAPLNWLLLAPGGLVRTEAGLDQLSSSDSLTITVAGTYRLTGVGGGGGGGASNGASIGGNGAGGGACVSVEVQLRVGDVVSWTVGSGGAKGVYAVVHGANGGATTISVNGGQVLSAPGGTGGQNSNSGAVVAPGGDGDFDGGDGAVGTSGLGGGGGAGAIFEHGNAASSSTGGAGPLPAFGDGGDGSNSGAGESAAWPGGGGGGGWNADGGAGAGGAVIIERL